MPSLEGEPTLEGEPGLVASSVYAAGRRVTAIPVSEAKLWLGKPGHVVWIGLLEPGEDLLHRVQTQFGLHDLAIQDASRAHQRPKLERYGDALFVVARTAQMSGGRIVFGQAEFTKLGPPDLPVLPEWSPVAKVPGHYRAVAPQPALAHQCAGACGVHAHAHDVARKSTVPVSDFAGFWGALGCSCFAF